ncbi:MAG: hypothetical protein L3J96_02940 [Thermoplasmata archaeon]|nr:hypothetical protein [Thermoplasmata archaeon]
MTDTSTLESVAVFGALITILLAVRTYRMLTGTPYSAARLFAFTGIYVALFVLLVAEEYTLLPWYLLPGYGAIILGAAVAWTPHIRRSVRIDRRPDGVWIYRLGALIPLIYLSLFLVRLTINAVVLNQSFTSPPTVMALSPGAQLAVAFVDALFAFSTGLLLARSVGVYQAFQALPPAARSPSGTEPLGPT